MLVMFILLKWQSCCHGNNYNNYIWLLTTLPFCIWERILHLQYTIPLFQELYVAYNNVSDLSQVGMLENLQLLDLESNDVDDLVQVQYLGLCANLQTLILEGNPVCLCPNPTAPQVCSAIFVYIINLNIIHWSTPAKRDGTWIRSHRSGWAFFFFVFHRQTFLPVLVWLRVCPLWFSRHRYSTNKHFSIGSVAELEPSGESQY